MSETLLQSPQSWLSRQPQDFREAFTALAHIERHPAGKRLCNVDDEITSLLGFIEGCVTLSWPAPGDEICMLHLFWPDDWLGEVPLLTGRGSLATLDTRTPVKLARVFFSDIHGLLEKRPEWWRCFGELASMHTHLAADVALDLMLRDPMARCVAVMLRAAGGRLQSNAIPKSTILPISQEELALFSNLHRNSINKVLRELCEEKLIQRHYRSIELLDVPGLRRLVIERADTPIGG